MKYTLYFYLYCKVCRFWRNLHCWQKFYTAAGSDGMDKFHLCFFYRSISDQYLLSIFSTGISTYADLSQQIGWVFRALWFIIFIRGLLLNLSSDMFSNNPFPSPPNFCNKLTRPQHAEIFSDTKSAQAAEIQKYKSAEIQNCTSSRNTRCLTLFQSSKATKL